MCARESESANLLLITLMTQYIFFLGLSAYSASTVDSVEFSNKDSLLMQILSTQQKHQCQYCKKKFVCPSLLARHIRIHTGERPYVCQICQKTFTQTSNLYLHMRRHEGIKPFKCSLCDYSATESSSVKKHMINKH